MENCSVSTGQINELYNMGFGTAGVSKCGGSGGFHIAAYTQSHLERNSFDRPSKGYSRLLANRFQISLTCSLLSWMMMIALASNPPIALASVHGKDGKESFVSPRRETVFRQRSSGTCNCRRSYIRSCHPGTWVEMVNLRKANRKYQKLRGESPAIPCLWEAQGCHG